MKDLDKLIQMNFFENCLREDEVIDQHVIEKAESVDNDVSVLFVGNDICVDDMEDLS
jgi:hypothetical protein